MRTMHILPLLVGLLFLSGFGFCVLVVNTTAPSCTSGDAYFSTIQTAIDDSGAVANGTIIVCANGTAAYHENVVVSKSLNIYGNQSGVLVNASDPSSATVRISANYVNMSNFTLVGSSSFGYGLYIVGNNTVVNHLSIHDNSEEVVLDHNSNNTLHDIVALATSSVAIYLNYASNNTLYNISASNSGGYAISLGTSANNTVTNSTFSSSSSHAVYISSSAGNLFYNNLFNGTRSIDTSANSWNTTLQVGIRIYSAGTEIGGNYWTNPSGTGYSDTCTDSDHDGICDSSYSPATNNVDYLPLSPSYVRPPLVVNGTSPACTAASAYYSSISSAVSAASSGDTIIVCDNSSYGYHDNVAVNIPLNIYGNQSGVLVTAANPASSVFRITANYVNISNFTVTGATTSGTGVEVNAAGGTYSNIRATGNNYGFYLNSANNCSFISINTTNNTDEGFLISVSSGNNFTSVNSSNNTYGFYFASIIGSDNNRFTNVNANNNGWDGFYIWTSNSTFTSVNAINNADDGFYFYESSNNTLIDINASNNRGSDGGIAFVYALYASNNNSVTNSFIANNTVNGIYSAGSITLMNDHFSNNHPDFRIAASTTLNITNSIFDSPAGNLINYTNLSITDSLTGGGYSINWSAQPAALSTGEISFAGKFVNISRLSGSPSIDNVTWSWQTSELTGYDATKFELWNYSSGAWSKMSGVTLTENALSVTNLNPTGNYGVLQNISDTIYVNGSTTCDTGNHINYPTITSAINSANAGNTIIVCANGSGVYNENVVVDKALNIYGNETWVVVSAANPSLPVFNISANLVNITNFTVKNTNTSSLATSASGFYLNYVGNVALSQVRAQNNSHGIYLMHGGNNTLTSVNASNNSYGFYLSHSTSNVINFSIAVNNTYDGFHLDTSDNNTFRSNNASYNGHIDGYYTFNGFYVYNSTGNIFDNNTAANNTHLGFYLSSASANQFNNSDLFNNGIGGYYITLSNSNNFSYDKVYNHPSYGYFFNYSNSSLVSRVNASNNVWQGFLLMYSHNNTFSNSNASGGNDGFDVELSANNTFVGVNASDNTNGFWLAYASGSNISDSFAQENSNYDFLNDLPTGASATMCIITISNLTGSGGRPINYSYSSVSWSNLVVSELMLCNASGSVLNNVTVHGSDALRNNGLLFQLTNNSVISNSNAVNVYYGINFGSSHSNNITNFTASNITTRGIALFVSEHNRVDNATVTNADVGILVSGASHNNTFTNLNLTAMNLSNQGYAFQISSSDNNTLSNSTIRNVSIGIYSSSTQGNSFVNVSFSNGTYGIATISSSITTFTNNSFDDFTAPIVLTYSSQLNFSGNNSMTLRPSTNLTLVLQDNGVFSSGSYRIVTPNLSFGFSGQNVSVSILNLSQAGLNVSVDSISGISNLQSAKVVQSDLGNYYGLIVSNNSATYSFTPRMYYNASDLSGYSTTYLGIGGFSDVAQAHSSIVDESAHSITPSSAITSVSTSGDFFAPLVYSLIASSNHADNTAHRLPTLTSSFSSETGALEVRARYNEYPISGMSIRLFHSGTAYDYVSAAQTDDSGVARFIILSSGKYEVESSLSGYLPVVLDLQELNLVSTSATAVENQTIVQPQITPTQEDLSQPAVENEISQQTQPSEPNPKLPPTASANSTTSVNRPSKQPADQPVSVNSQQPPQTGWIMFAGLVVLIVAIGAIGIGYYMTKRKSK